MEGDGGASIIDLRIRDGQRQSVFRSYVWPEHGSAEPDGAHRSTGHASRRSTATASRASSSPTGGFAHGRGGLRGRALAGRDQHSEAADAVGHRRRRPSCRRSASRWSSICPASAGTTRTIRGSIACGRAEPLAPRNSGGEATLFWKSNPALASPDVQVCLAEFPLASAETRRQLGVPEHGWTMCAGLAHPKSRGRVRLTGPDPGDPIAIEANTLAHPDDMKAPSPRSSSAARSATRRRCDRLSSARSCPAT